MQLSPQDVEIVVAELAGQDVVPLLKALRNKSNVSEFSLATQIRKEINVTRNMLYRLYDHNLVSFTRKKDKKKGWYIYYWTFNVNRVEHLLHELHKKKLERLTERLNREKNSTFFICPNGCIRLVFDQAADFNYKCPECGTLLQQEDNAQKVADIEKEITVLATTLEETTARKRPEKRKMAPSKKTKSKPVKKKKK